MDEEKYTIPVSGRSRIEQWPIVWRPQGTLRHDSFEVCPKNNNNPIARQHWELSAIIPCEWAAIVYWDLK